MYTVGQFARICNVSAKTLRFYDSIGLFRPAAVGSDNQYRYYARDQIAPMQRILFLRELGLGPEVIREVMKSGALGDPDRLAAILHERAGQVQAAMAEQAQLLARLEGVIASLRKEGGIPVLKAPAIAVKEVPALPIISVRRRIAVQQHSELIMAAFGKLAGRRPAGPPMSLYHEPDFDPADYDTEVAIPVEAGAEQTLPAVRVAYAMHIGPYDQVGAAYAAILDWVNANGHTAAGPVREIYLAGPEGGRPAAEWVTEIQVPIQ